MSHVKVIRSIFQLAAFGIFVFQMQNSIRKYFDKPIVQQSSTKRFDEISKPLMYVCQNDQFNYSAARNYGYLYKTTYTIGKLNTSKLSWKGIYGNETYQNLQTMFHDIVYTNLSVQASETGFDSGLEDIDTDQVYVFPFGYCKKVKKVEIQNYFETTNDLLLIIMDPEKENQIWVHDMKHGKLEFGHSETGIQMGLIYEIELGIHDSRIQHGQTCTDYARIGSTYGKCIEDSMRDSFLEWYNCLPPWLPTTLKLTCEVDKDIMKPNQEDEIKIEDEFYNLFNGLEFSIFKKCLPPCQLMNLDLDLRDRYMNNPDEAYLQINFKKEVLITTDVYSYDMFSLIVDLGSALGLWLGLSALSIFDFLLDFSQDAKGISFLKMK